jgi:hypothetical protein
VALRGGRVVEAVGHARAFHRLLRDAVDERRLGEPGELEDRRGDVDDMAELVA